MRTLIVTGDGVEGVEFTYPYYRLQERDVEVDVAAPNGESFESKHGQSFDATTLAIEDAEVGEYDLLVLPGGRAPENLRLEAPGVPDLVREFDAENKPIASICHGAQLLVSADVLEGRAATGYWSLEVDIENAGANFVDEEVVVDDNLVCSRAPDDLPAFMRETLTFVSEEVESSA
jgi:protease I